ncbi:hypothetical protein [Enemella evansiae]|uniref:DUF600 family protein n=1 Tax=Enemella evansiae TaxID=2016499 RepID=A0A255GFU6_9ACTN|nr:hypothetical protein [Enemella evansiae]PFG67943.1 hypothetical protein B0O41_2767 [Propionibacteriaceae bacterium ES.041]OYN95848.1 hypothetical protein CGZ96_15280 [Enemella evansiae]OYO04057.1 hypothetical protein CGZ97_11810 [Enemella evansiae]OYO08368.1 hypothetical protein CGZ98_17705 [Enemella evansiae]OYO14730.1 hypothetical protein CGZ94_09205 [Enemella evansiae]
MTPEQLDQFVTAILQECVNVLPDQFDEMWLVVEDEDGVSTSALFFTDTAGPHRMLRLGDDADDAIDDLIDAAIEAGQPIHRAVLNYRSSGGASADFDYDPLPGGVVDGSDARFDAFAREHLGRPYDEVPDHTA